jgi:uncharacterized protein YndB with AHSA1/START domain
VNSIEKTVVVRAAPERAFAIFTDRITDWWPPTHRLGGDPSGTVHLQQSGRFFERASDGQEFEMGRVRVWQPPELVMLDFYLGTGPDNPTSVSITFAPEGEDTRVSVEHRPTPASLQAWEQTAAHYVEGWGTVLPSFQELVTTAGEQGWPKVT